MWGPDPVRLEKKGGVEGTATVGLDTYYSHLVQQRMVSGSRIFWGRGHLHIKWQESLLFHSTYSKQMVLNIYVGGETEDGSGEKSDESLKADQLLLIGGIS